MKKNTNSINTAENATLDFVKCKKKKKMERDAKKEKKRSSTICSHLFSEVRLVQAENAHQLRTF